MPSVVVVYHSGYGHTKVQAEAVARGAASVDGAKVLLVPVEDVEMHWNALHAADAIVFGSPTYMGSVSAKMKAFMEETSKHWAALKWRDKIAGGFTNSASQSGDKLNTLTDFVIFAMQHGMIWVGLDLMLAILAPHDQPHVGRGCIAQRHRRPGLAWGFHQW